MHGRMTNCCRVERVFLGALNVYNDIAEKHKAEILAQESIVQELARLIDAECTSHHPHSSPHH